MESNKEIPVKFVRQGRGVYVAEGTNFQIIKDVEETVASDQAADRAYHGDKRYNVTMHDHLAYGPEEVTWIVMRIEDGREDNLGMFDTLREAKAFLVRRIEKESR